MGINARDSWWIEMMEMRKSIVYLMEVNNCLFWCLEGCPQITQITCRLEGPLWSSILCLRLTARGHTVRPQGQSWALGSWEPWHPISRLRLPPPLPSLPGNYGMPCERGKHAVHLGGSLEAWMLLNCMKPPCSVTTSQQSQQFSEESSGDRLNTMESPNWFLHVPTSYEHQTTLVFPSVDVEWCRYITILSLLIPPKSTHYPRIGWKKCRETHCFMDKTSIPDQPSGPCRVEPESAQGQRVFADKLCRDVDKNLVESPGGKQGGMGWMVLVSPNRWKNPTLNGKTARCWW
jgi:hypothetical protein